MYTLLLLIYTIINTTIIIIYLLFFAVLLVGCGGVVAGWRGVTLVAAKLGCRRRRKCRESAQAPLRERIDQLLYLLGGPATGVCGLGDSDPLLWHRLSIRFLGIAAHN